jgi:hypothetical protein
VRAWLARSWRPLLYGAAKLFDFHGVIK